MIALFRNARFRRRLRHLQRRYYTAAKKSDDVILEYVQTLATAREFELRLTDVQGIRALHAGAGGHRLPGWINADSIFDPTNDLVADLGAGIPLRSDSVDFIHSEDFLEHLSLDAGKRFLAESHRVLKRGGVMRILTPDLRLLIESVYLSQRPEHLAWCDAQLGTSGPCEALNMHLRMDGEHRFIYDERYLTKLLSDLGFRVRRVSWNRSRHRFLRYVDLRGFGLSMFVEATK